MITTSPITGYDTRGRSHRSQKETPTDAKRPYIPLYITYVFSLASQTWIASSNFALVVGSSDLDRLLGRLRHEVLLNPAVELLICNL